MTYLRNHLTETRKPAKNTTITHQGGIAYTTDAQRQLRRFLILGSEGGTFYVTQKELANLNIQAVGNALVDNYRQAIDTIVDVSDRALAPSNNPALLALAIASSIEIDRDKELAASIRTYALSKLAKVARTGTHLFTFLGFVTQMRGWGSGLRRAVGDWYIQRSDMSLVNQVTKYAQREGWSHADVLRLSHPKAKTPFQNELFRYVVDNIVPEQKNDASDYLLAVQYLKNNDYDEATTISMIHDYGLPREVLPTQALASADVWDHLLSAKGGMPITAMVRNLGTMTKLGTLKQGSSGEMVVVMSLRDAQKIKDSRIHPIDLLKAKLVYQSGQGFRSDASWKPLMTVIDALEDAFYLAFENVEPHDKRVMHCLDVSGSMTYPNNMLNVPGLSPRMATGALALVAARTESMSQFMAFSNKLVDMNINKHDSLNDVLGKIDRLPFGGTDCRVPMEYAKANGLKIDAFVVYTDNETGYGNPSDALRDYRNASAVKDSKLIVNAMQANNLSIADPTDPNMLDIVGFDTSGPQTISAFVRGEV